jgi:hypothetical protein
MREDVTMLYRALIGAGLSACVAACVGSPAAPAMVSPSMTAASLPPAGCVSQSATRIPAGPTECAASGHVWTSDAIRGTGATEPAAALRLLDPTLTVRGQ